MQKSTYFVIWSALSWAMTYDQPLRILDSDHYELADIRCCRGTLHTTLRVRLVRWIIWSWTVRYGKWARSGVWLVEWNQTIRDEMVQEIGIFHVYAVSSRSEKNAEPCRSLWFQGAWWRGGQLFVVINVSIVWFTSFKWAYFLNRVSDLRSDWTVVFLVILSTKQDHSWHILVQKYHSCIILTHQPNTILNHPGPSYPTNQTKSCIILSHQPNTILVSSHPGSSHPSCTIPSHSPWFTQPNTPLVAQKLIIVHWVSRN